MRLWKVCRGLRAWHASQKQPGTRQTLPGPSALTTRAKRAGKFNDKQSAHLRVTGTLTDAGYTVTAGELRFDRVVKGLRNSFLLPAGWEVSSVSQSGTIGQYQGRAFVALVNLNAENAYRVVITARKRAD